MKLLLIVLAVVALAACGEDVPVGEQQLAIGGVAGAAGGCAYADSFFWSHDAETEVPSQFNAWNTTEWERANSGGAIDVCGFAGDEFEVTASSQVSLDDNGLGYLRLVADDGGTVTVLPGATAWIDWVQPDLYEHITFNTILTLESDGTTRIVFEGRAEPDRNVLRMQGGATLLALRL